MAMAPRLSTNLCRSARDSAVVQEPQQVITEVVCVGAGAVDQRRLATTQELQTHHIHARRRYHAAVVAYAALAVENVDVKPGVVRPVAGCPDDASDTGTYEFQLKRRLRFDLGGWQATRRLHLAVKTIVGRPLVGRGQQPIHLEIGQSA